jgi:hypothetical protein
LPASTLRCFWRNTGQACEGMCVNTLIFFWQTTACVWGERHPFTASR